MGVGGSHGILEGGKLNEGPLSLFRGPTWLNQLVTKTFIHCSPNAVKYKIMYCFEAGLILVPAFT